MDNKQHFSLWYIVGVVLFLLAVQSFLGDPHVQVLTYSNFQALLQAGKIKEVTITEDQLTGIAEGKGISDAARAEDAIPAPAAQAATAPGADDHKFLVARVPDANLVAELHIPRGIGALGFTQQLPTEDRYLLKYSELLDRLDVLLGGRVAEQLVYGEISTGAQNDLQRATDMARHMVTQYGMSPLLGAATLQNAGSQMFLPVAQAAARGEYSERTAQSIDEEVRRLLGEAEQRVRTTLTEKRVQLDGLARALLEHETVDRSALLALLNKAFAPALQAVS